MDIKKQKRVRNIFPVKRAMHSTLAIFLYSSVRAHKRYEIRGSTVGTQRHAWNNDELLIDPSILHERSSYNKLRMIRIAKGCKQTRHGKLSC